MGPRLTLERYNSDMADIELGWEVKGSISPSESVSAMLKVIAEKGEDDTGTFWCWDGRVRPNPLA